MLFFFYNCKKLFNEIHIMIEFSIFLISIYEYIFIIFLHLRKLIIL